ncbi:MAG: hypothetical protein M3519_11015 [Actinomycetota bacterium]|nr:hypothetical protein [Actinomycetota bacterium]
MTPGRGQGDEDFDARFAEIVANLRAQSEDEVTRPGVDGPSADGRPTDGRPTDRPPEGDARPRPVPEWQPDGSPPPPEPGAAETSDPQLAPEAEDTGQWRGWADDDEEGHFVPPDPPPLPAGDLHFWGIFVGLIGGPVILVLAHVVGVLSGSIWSWLGIGLAIGGFVLLVLRLPTHHDDDPSGGARV